MSKEKTKVENTDEVIEDAEVVETAEAEEAKTETPEEKLQKELESQKDMYLVLAQKCLLLQVPLSCMVCWQQWFTA